MGPDTENPDYVYRTAKALREHDHGSLKNVFIAATGHFDQHVPSLWQDGHIKFWSTRTLRTLILKQGFKQVRFLVVVGIPALTTFIIATFTRPAT